MKTKIEKWIQEDGRRAERRVTETKFDKEGQAERTIELHLEDPRPLKLQQRIVEKIKPVIFERKIETINPLTGEVIERKVETVEQKVPMQVVDHISVVESNNTNDPTQNVNFDHAAPEGVPLYLQNKDLKALVDLLKNGQKDETNSNTDEFETKLKSLGMAEQAARKSSKDNFSSDKLLMGVIVAQVIALGYVLFFM